MKRSGCLAAFVLVLIPSLAHAQMGGMMGGAGRGGRGGMGMGGMAMGMGGMGGGMGGGFGGPMAPAIEQIEPVRRAVRVEVEGKRTLMGHLELGYVRITSDLGAYVILPDRVASIRFLKPQDGDRAVQVPQPPRGPDGNRQADAEQPEEIHVKAVTTTGEEIVGILQDPIFFRIEMDFGSVVPQTQKLRSFTFTDGKGQGAPGTKGEKETANERQKAEPGRAEHPRSALRLPPYHRLGNAILVASAVGDRLTYYDLETHQSRSIELSGTADAPLQVTPIDSPDIVALSFKGAKITRLAAVDRTNRMLYVQELRQPAKGQVMPIVAPGIAVYAIGRYLYAYSATAHRWDVAELPVGMVGFPNIGPDGASLEGPGHVFTFLPKTGKWEHIDVRAILDLAGAEPKR